MRKTWTCARSSRSSPTSTAWGRSRTRPSSSRTRSRNRASARTSRVRARRTTGACPWPPTSASCSTGSRSSNRRTWRWRRAGMSRSTRAYQRVKPEAGSSVKAARARRRNRKRPTASARRPGRNPLAVMTRPPAKRPARPTTRWSQRLRRRLENASGGTFRLKINRPMRNGASSTRPALKKPSSTAFAATPNPNALKWIARSSATNCTLKRRSWAATHRQTCQIRATRTSTRRERTSITSWQPKRGGRGTTQSRC